MLEHLPSSPQDSVIVIALLTKVSVINDGSEKRTDTSYIKRLFNNKHLFNKMWAQRLRYNDRLINEGSGLSVYGSETHRAQLYHRPTF